MAVELLLLLIMYLVDISWRLNFQFQILSSYIYRCTLQVGSSVHQCCALSLSPLHAVVPPVDDVEADEVEREEHPARLINPEARDAFATTSIITLGTIHK